MFSVFSCVVYGAIVFNAHASDATTKDVIVLTGQVSSAAKQVVNAPKTSRWQSQLQWLAEEGSIVSKGELVAVFDGAIEQTQLEQNKETIDRLSLELSQLELEQKQKLMDAQGTLKLAKMRVDKARIEASVPDGQVSKFEKGQFELDLQRAMMEQVKAEDALERSIQESRSTLQNKKLDILKAEEQITYLESILSNMSIVAEHTGPVSHANHPWYGTKITAGSNLNASWKVLDLQAIEDFQVETFVHEVDAVDLSPNSHITLIIDAFPRQQFVGHITKLSTQSEKKPEWGKSSYFPMTIRFDEQPDFKLLPGMSVRVIVEPSKSLASSAGGDNEK